MTKLYYVDDPTFRRKRFQHLKSINAENGDDTIWWQLPGTRMNKWMMFEDFSPVLFELNDCMLRTSMNNEIVMDLDKKIFKDETSKELNMHATIEANIEKALEIIAKLEKENIQTSLYYSGNKGFHIKMLIGNFDIDNKEIIKVFKLKNYDSKLFFRLLKEGFLDYFGFELGLDTDDAIDPRLMIKKQLLRTEGSMHDKSNKWKTYINLEGVTDKTTYIKSIIDKTDNKTNINWNYLKSKNLINLKITNHIFEHLKSNFEKELIKEITVPKYNTEINKDKILPRYLKVFKELYHDGQRFTVAGAIISFLFWITEKDRQKAYEIYYKEFRDLSERSAETQFQARFNRTWQTCEQADMVSFYSILEKNNIITKEKFKLRLKNGK